MVLVYSKTEDDRGRVIDPDLFSTPARGAELVYADDEIIVKAYQDLGIETKPLAVKEVKKGK